MSNTSERTNPTTIRQFFNHLYEAVDYMQQYPELTAKRKALESNISECMDIFLATKRENQSITLDSSFNIFLQLFSKESKESKESKVIIYLCDFLIFGLLVHEGESIQSAYTNTLAKYDNFIERIVVKSLMKDKYFRKLKNDEEYEISNIRNYLSTILERE